MWIKIELKQVRKEILDIYKELNIYFVYDIFFFKLVGKVFNRKGKRILFKILLKNGQKGGFCLKQEIQEVEE